MTPNSNNLNVIAKKSRQVPNDSGKGYIRPIFYRNSEETKYKLVSENSLFPNEGEIFIIKGYNYIEDNYSEDDLFEIGNIFQNDVSFDAGRRGSCFFTATTSILNPIEPWEYIKIFDSDLDLKERSATNISLNTDYVPFFIRKDGYLIGPFNYDVYTLNPADRQYFDSEVVDNDNFENNFVTNEDVIYKFEINDVFEFISGDYVINFRQLFNSTTSEESYFGTKERLIEWGKRKFSSLFSEDQKQILNQLVSIDFPESKDSLEKEKTMLFFEIVKETDTWLNIELPRYFNEFLKSEDGKEYLEKFLEDNKESLFSSYRLADKREIDEQIQKRLSYLADIELKINENISSSAEEQIFEGIDQDDIDILKTIIADDTSRKLLIGFYRENKRLEDITNDILRQEGALSRLNEDVSRRENYLASVKESMDAVKREFFKDADFAKKIIDAKIYTDLINNIDPSKHYNSLEIEQPSHPLVNFYSKQLTPKIFFDEISSRFKIAGRKISHNDLVNYMVLLNQNFITVFAGLPGVGKTSLIENLSRVLGLYDRHFLKIPVARGWTSSKDLLGYFNPLTKKYQSSKTGLLNFLRESELDSKEGNDIIRISLLDEANLSPIEHYWSDFLSLADNDYTKKINITDDEAVTFGEKLRFIATVNYDHTTEVLSDRLLSRAPIIKLQPSEYSYETETVTLPTFDTFTATQINGLLSRNNKDYFKGDIKNKFDSIVKSLQEEESGLGQPIIIGHRKYLAVERYCSVAGALMEDQNKFTALDYAVNQYILPLINGRGESYLKRLQSIKDKLQNMPQSLKQLTKIIESGNDNYRNYKFFC